MAIMAVAASGALGVIDASDAAAATVTVQPGQSLIQIAADLHTTVAALVAANQLADPNRVFAGQLLQVPAAGSSPTATPSPQGSSGEPTTLTVQRGQTLIQIAVVMHTTVAALVAANHLADANRVFAGQVLQVPAAGASPTATASLQGSSGGPTTVTVQRGQTLTKIAADLHTTVAALVAANHLANANRVFAGQVLQVVANATAGAATIALASYQTPAHPNWPAPLLSHPSRLALEPDFESAASTYGVPLSLLEALCWWESGWQTGLVSSTGALGVCQVEPYTATFVNQTLVHGSLDPHVATQNIDLGAAYLGSLLRATGGNVGTALAGYYQGLGSVTRNGMLPYTALYVHGIEAYSAIFAS